MENELTTINGSCYYLMIYITHTNIIYHIIYSRSLELLPWLKSDSCTVQHFLSDIFAEAMHSSVPLNCHARASRMLVCCGTRARARLDGLHLGVIFSHPLLYYLLLFSTDNNYKLLSLVTKSCFKEQLIHSNLF